ncbi:MAG: diguanylate cyclase [Dictyoglomaceae bacterium]
MEKYLKSYYQWIEEYIPWGVFAVDREFKIIFWNRWMEINTKKKKEEVLNKNLFEIFPELEKFRNFYLQALEGGSIILAQRFHKYLIPIKIEDEELKYMQQTAQIFPLMENEGIKGIITVIEDVTDRVKREENYKRQIRNLSILNDIQKSIFVLDFEECIEKIFDGILKLSNAPIVALFLKENGKLVLKKSTVNLEIDNEILNKPNCIINQALKEKKTLYISNIKETEIMCLEPSSNSLLALPLLGKEDTLGVLLLESFNRDAFKKNDILNLETIAMQGALILDNARLFSALKESEDRYRILAEQSLVGVFMIQEEKIIYVNPRFVELFAYPLKMETLEDFVNFISQEERERFRERYNMVLERSLDYIIDEFKARKSNNQTIYIEISMVNIHYKSKPTILGTILDITYRKQLEEELKILSITDALTELYNRRGFLTLAEHTLGLARRLNKKVIILFIDLDHMKWINDNLGHNVGDQALIDTANILRKTFRQNDLIARIGGDEFVVLGVIGEENHKEKIIERLMENVKKFNEEEKRPYEISLSVGLIVHNPEESISLEDLLEKADKLMYEEKRRKKEIKK